MTVETLSEFDLLVGRWDGRRPGSSEWPHLVPSPAGPERPHHSEAAPTPSFGPRTENVVGLLERAQSLTPENIECLAASAGQNCHGPVYAEALLAVRQAADRSGRSRASGLAASEAARIVIRRARSSQPLWALDAPEWAVVGEQAAWGAADAARALVVADLLLEAEFQALTQAWNSLD